MRFFLGVLPTIVVILMKRVLNREVSSRSSLKLRGRCIICDQSRDDDDTETRVRRYVNLLMIRAANCSGSRNFGLSFSLHLFLAEIEGIDSLFKRV